MKLAGHKLALQRLVEVTGAERGRKRESRLLSKWIQRQRQLAFFQLLYSLEMTVLVSYHTVDADKVLGFLGPSRKLHVTHRNAIFTHPKLVLITVHKHLRQVVELWDQLLMDKTE